MLYLTPESGVLHLRPLFGVLDGGLSFRRKLPLIAAHSPLRMQTLFICITAFLAAGLTLFSGFGLGTLLMPVLACFFPLEEAIAITAIAHFLNILKLMLLGRYADKHVVSKFGAPALLSALLGAWVLRSLVDQIPLASYHLFNHEFHITPLQLTISFWRCLLS